MTFSKEEEIRPRDVFKELLYWVEQDAYTLLKTADFEKISCPACKSDLYKEKFEKYKYLIVECCECQSLYVNPRPTKKSLNDFFSESRSANFFAEVFYPTVEKARREKLIPERAGKLQRFIKEKGFKNGVVIDVGAGQGFFLDALRENLPGFEFRAIEPNQKFAELCRKKNFKTAGIVAEENDQWQGIADIVTCFEVFEHVQNPEDFVASLKRLLKPEGCLLITSLSGDGFDIQLLQERSDIVAPPQHLNFLSIQGYKELFNNAGFKSLEIVTPGKLDVNIVENKIAEYPEMNLDSFTNFLLQQNDDVKSNFQTFLAENLLSSHVWIFAINQ